MPTLTIDSYLTAYDERADLAYDYAEWGTNRYGKRSHATAPQEGSADWNPDRVNQFIAFGTTNHTSRRGGLRDTPLMPLEGPHQNGASFLFKVPLENVTIDSAHMTYVPMGAFPDLTNVRVTVPLRMYGVASDNYVSRWVGSVYPCTYKGMFSPRQYGTDTRRYRVDSYQEHQEHTEAQVAWEEARNSGGQTLNTPDLSAILNEIIGRPGWRKHNTLYLYMVMNNKPPLDLGAGGTWTGGPYPPSDTYSAGGGCDIYGCDEASKPQLIITYH